VAAIGPATAAALRDVGIRADFVPSQFVAESVAAEWPERDMAGKRVLLPRAKEARELLPDRLREMGAAVDVVTAYEPVRDASAADDVRGQLLEGAIHAVTFTSSSTVTNFVEAIGRESLADALRNVVVACIGPITAETARNLGIEPTIVSDEFTIPGIVDSLVASVGAGQEQG
jgi:uroporphyrinogen III methyltransferase / synthase